jgi:hypothetical protein
VEFIIERGDFLNRFLLVGNLSRASPSIIRE